MCNLRKTAFLSDIIYFMVRIISETKIFFSGKNEETILPHGLEESLFQLIFQWWVLATLEMFWRKFTFRENRLILCVFYKVHKIEYRTFQKRMLWIKRCYRPLLLETSHYLCVWTFFKLSNIFSMKFKKFDLIESCLKGDYKKVLIK